MHGYAGGVNKRSTLACHHCCEGEFCNLYGCPDSEDITVLPSTRCLGCDAVKDPKFCDKMINCPYSQQCVSYGVFHAGGLRFELGCEEKLYCNAFKNNSYIKRDVTHHVGEIDLASTCCDSHLCNRNWPPVDQPTPKIVSGFTCQHQTHYSTSPTAVTNLGPQSQSTAGPTSSSQDITIPSSENCKDRATESNCQYLNRTMQLCDAITLTSVYYCVKFCGFCSPIPTLAHLTTPIVTSSHSDTSTPSTSSPPVTQKPSLKPFPSTTTAGPATVSPNITIPPPENCTDNAPNSACDYLNRTTQLCATASPTAIYYCSQFCGLCSPVTTPGSPVTVSKLVPQDIPVLGKRHYDKIIDDDTNQGGLRPIT